MSEREHDAGSLGLGVQEVGSGAETFASGPCAGAGEVLSGGDRAGESVLLTAEAVQDAGARCGGERESDVRDRGDGRQERCHPLHDREGRERDADGEGEEREDPGGSVGDSGDRAATGQQIGQHASRGERGDPDEQVERCLRPRRVGEQARRVDECDHARWRHTERKASPGGAGDGDAVVGESVVGAARACRTLRLGEFGEAVAPFADLLAAEAADAGGCRFQIDDRRIESRSRPVDEVTGVGGEHLRVLLRPSELLGDRSQQGVRSTQRSERGFEHGEDAQHDRPDDDVRRDAERQLVRRRKGKAAEM